MNKKHYVHLTDSDVKKLKDLIRNKSTTQTMAHRCHILLELDENNLPVSSYDHCVKEHGMCRSTVRNIVRRFALEGLDAALQYHRNKNSDNARRKVDGRMEATLIQIACGPVPEGNSHWTVSMLAKEMKIRFGEDAISRDTVSRTLKKQTRPHRSEYWCLPSVADAKFIAHMEDVLDVYERPYDELHPVVCMDEKPYQL